MGVVDGVCDGIDGISGGFAGVDRVLLEDRPVRRVIYQKPERIETASIGRIAIDTAQLATMLGVSPRTLSRWRSGLGLPYLRIGSGARSTILYLPPDVVRWLKQWQQNPVQ